MDRFSRQASLSLSSHCSCSCHLDLFCPSNIPTHSHLQPLHWSFCLDHSQGDTWLSLSNALKLCLNITSSSNPVRNSALLSLDSPGHTYAICFSPLPYHLLPPPLLPHPHDHLLLDFLPKMWFVTINSTVRAKQTHYFIKRHC